MSVDCLKYGLTRAKYLIRVIIMHVIWIKCLVEKRLHDQFIQECRADLDVRSSCSLYNEYKNKFEFEKYLSILPERT